MLLAVLNGIADTIDSVSWIGVVSPFHWMEKTTSAAPGGTFDLGATIGLAVAGPAVLALAIPIFQRRDIGSGLFRFGRHASVAIRVASRNLMLRLPFTEGLWEQRVGLAVWVVSTLLLGSVMVSVTKSVSDALFADPRLAAVFLHAAPGPVYAALLGFIWFGFALLLLAGYSVVQVSRWAAQDQEGRVEMLLSVPISRSRVVVDRSLEFAVASRWPRIAVPFLAAFAVVEYFLGDLAPLFKLPDWLANLSTFHLYGNPIVGATPWTPAVWMLLVFLLGFGAALVLMQRRDVSSA